jgi:predicted membrane channel-forming protein YqfA (hemolysin III family)
MILIEFSSFFNQVRLIVVAVVGAVAGAGVVTAILPLVYVEIVPSLNLVLFLAESASFLLAHKHIIAHIMWFPTIRVAAHSTP